MRSILATYRKLLSDCDRDDVQFFQDELKWLAGVCGEAPDVEVMHPLLKDMIAQNPAELVLGPSLVGSISSREGYERGPRQSAQTLNGKSHSGCLMPWTRCSLLAARRPGPALPLDVGLRCT
jgi:hypothetical protein